MQINIISDDSVVIVDGVAANVDLSQLDKNIASVHFDTEIGTGEVIERDGAGNHAITDFLAYRVYVQRWDDACQAGIAAVNANLNTLGYQEVRRSLYPPLGDLIVAMWEKMIEGRDDIDQMITELETRRATVKSTLAKDASNKVLRAAHKKLSGVGSFDAVPDHERKAETI